MDQAQQAFATALRILSRRDHSEAELRRKLKDRDYPGEVQDVVVARLKGLGYLDDRRSARLWAESAVRNGRGFGPKLRMELARRGFPPEIVTEVLAGIAASSDERELVRDILARKFPAFDPVMASDRERLRVMGYLQRRGFSTGLLFRILRYDE